MSARQTEAAQRAAAMVAAGMSYRAAAKAAGVALSTCVKAVQLERKKAQQAQ